MSDTLKKVMLVEDDEEIAFMTVVALQDFGGLEVRHCPSGHEALACFDEFAPQIVLMDVMMPGLDGPGTLESLRRKPSAKDVPVVFMTAKAQTHQQQEYLDLGAVAVIAKPFNPIELAERLNTIWHSARGD